MARRTKEAVGSAADPGCGATRKATKAEAKAAKAEARAESKAATAAAKAAAESTRAEARVAKATATSRAEKKAAKATAKVAKAEAKTAKAEAKAAGVDKKAAKAEVKAAKAEAKIAKTRPARLLDRATDPKTAKRLVTVGKILAPALAPLAIKAATGARGALDQARARRLGVAVGEVAAYRGPTGPTGARITGLTDAVRELATRPGKDLQVTRFTEVASTRLTDLTAVVQAAATMPRARRSEVLRAVDRELDGIDADLVSHLLAPRPR